MEDSSPGMGNSPAGSLSADPQPPAKRKRLSKAASSRGVANLTPEQLARKRANDREAQRAIRERTKSQIETLQNRIRELESQQPYNDLQVVLREKEAVQAENDDIKRRLSAIWNIVQPILGLQGLNDLVAPADRNPTESSESTSQSLRGRNYPYSDPTSQPHHNSYPKSQNIEEGPIDQVPVTSQNDESAEAKNWSLPGMAPTSNIRGSPRNSPQYDSQRSPRTSEGNYSHSDERLGVNFLLDGGRHLKAQNGQSHGSQMMSPLSPRIADGYSPRPVAAYGAIPLNAKPTCTLDYIIIDFLRKRQAQAAHGVPRMELVGPPYPNFTALVYADRNVEAHSLSKLITDILRTFPDISRLPEQVATLYAMFLMMRWQIDASKENYDRLPEWLVPRPSQLLTPHPAWIDHIPWPTIRDKMIQTNPFQSLESFFVPFTTTISVNWPYKPEDCLLPGPGLSRGSFSTPSAAYSAASPYSSGTAAAASSPQTPATTASNVHSFHDEQWVINPVFESHMRELSNWSLGPAFRHAFPHLVVDGVRINDR